jgi:hypothetical protein
VIDSSGGRGVCGGSGARGPVHLGVVIATIASATSSVPSKSLRWARVVAADNPIAKAIRTFDFIRAI